MKKTKILFKIFGFILFPLVANATDKIDWVQGFKLTKEEKLSIEEKKVIIKCEEYEYSYKKPKRCWSNYSHFRNNTNLSYNYWSPSISIYEFRRSNHFSHLESSTYPNSIKDWNKYKKNKLYIDLK